MWEGFVVCGKEECLMDHQMRMGWWEGCKGEADERTGVRQHSRAQNWGATVHQKQGVGGEGLCAKGTAGVRGEYYAEDRKGEQA